jgi:hypothetical protein
MESIMNEIIIRVGGNPANIQVQQKPDPWPNWLKQLLIAAATVLVSVVLGRLLSI